jgi:hypothetical protein
MIVTPETKVALTGAIVKWDKILTALIVAEKTNVDDVHEGGRADCPLCLIFHPLGQNLDCVGCPVLADTGTPKCGGTPYRNWDDDDDFETREVIANDMLAYLKKLDEKCEVVGEPE